MGGHALERGSLGYGDAARLGHALGREPTVATGGGPGAMEAANLGAFFAARSAASLDDAIAPVSVVRSLRPRAMEAHIHLVDSVEEAVEVVSPSEGID